MHGGVSYIANRYGNANNKYMKEYDEKAPSKYIMYLDANNLYGWAMSQYLPTGNFKWMTDKERMHHKMNTIRSQRHQLGSYEINKVSLSCFDDKRYIHDNGTSSYAYGHYKTK